ncbi:colicin D domain-containing protein [Neisseria cinerea]
MNIDEQAVHDLLTRQIDLLRFERSLAQDVLRQLARMREDVEERLRRRDLAELNRRELERLLADISAILAHYYGLIGNDMAKVQRQTVEDESDWLFWWLGALAADFALSGNVKPLSDTARADIGKNVLTGGLTLGEALASLRRNLFESLMRTVRLAEAGGAALADVGDVFRRHFVSVRTFTRTWMSSVSNTVRSAFGSANGMVKGWRHISVLDAKTSGMCTARNGLMWDRQKKPIGHDYPFAKPPLHPNCRSMLIIVFDADAPFDDVSGEDWVKSRSLPQLQEQFGKGVGQMLHEGKISLADAVRSDGLAAVTLADLRRKYDPLYIVPFVDTAILQGAGFSQSQMRKKFKHASVFGIDARKSNPKNWKAFQEAVVSHLNDEQTVLKGRYRLEGSKVFYNGQTDIAVVFDKDNRFVTAMKISGKQREHYLNTDYLQ